jgi:hypothetical protein
MSPWFLNIFINEAIREVNTRVKERGRTLMSDSGGDCQVNQILYTDDTALLADE